jgi:hypothetical protein
MASLRSDIEEFRSHLDTLIAFTEGTRNVHKTLKRGIPRLRVLFHQITSGLTADRISPPSCVGAVGGTVPADARRKVSGSTVSPKRQTDVSQLGPHTNCHFDICHDDSCSSGHTGQPDFDSPKRSDLDSPKRTDFDSPKRSDLDSPKRTDLDSPKRTDLDSPKRTDFDSPKRAFLRQNPGKTKPPPGKVNSEAGKTKSNPPQKKSPPAPGKKRGNNTTTQFRPSSLPKPSRKRAEVVISVPDMLGPMEEGPRLPKSTSYASVLRRLMGAENLPKIKQIRCNHQGEIVLGLTNPSSLSEVTEAVRECAPEAKVKTRIPTMRLEIRGIHPGVERGDISASLAREIGAEDPALIRVGGLRPSFGGLKVCSAEVPWSAAARALVRRGAAVIGLISCRIVTTSTESSCYRCWGPGHLARECRGADRSALCKRCCGEGHRAADCRNQPNCADCKQQHRFGSRACKARKAVGPQ